ncbi:MAG: dihydrolipoyl dehydrogenase [Planctomycetota bacterium]|jgi:dihydrolipoamide dehydrogenase
MMAENMKDIRLLVLGGGPAGYAGAFHAADLGMQVTLVDLEPDPGGVCLYRGCIPSKALLHVSKIIREAAEAEEFGVTFGKPKVDLAKLRCWKNNVVKKLTSGLGSLTRSRKIEFIHGHGTFKDSNTLHISKTDGTETDKSFDYCLLATGSSPVIPEIFPESPLIIDSSGALAIKDIPQKLLVIGGGYIGLEMSMVYSTLGSEVTVVEMGNHLLPGADKDLVDILTHSISKKLAALHLNTRVVSLIETDSGINAELSSLDLDDNIKKYDKVLIAVGRKPNITEIGLELIGIDLNSDNFIKTDIQRRSSVSNIFAVGDVAGNPMLAHKASYEARMAVEVISGKPSAFDAQSIPAVMFTDPEVAWCGLTETEAKDRNIPVKIARFPWGASGRALTLNRQDGLTKIIANPSTGQILGVGVVGNGAGELLSEGSFAVEIGARMEDLKMTVHAHPTLSETIMEAAESFFGASTHFYTKL